MVKCARESQGRKKLERSWKDPTHLSIRKGTIEGM